MSLHVSIRKRLSKNFHLEVEFENSGGWMGILGASGCGKSMTLKCIAGIETPNEGRICLNDRVLFDAEKKINVKPQQRRVGYLFQNYALFPRMSVRENITAGLALSRKEKLKVAAGWLERFGLEDLQSQRPGQLSGGQQQRTALARMLIREPELILLDEPFSALDTCLREQTQLQIQSLIDSRKDLILVTHNRDEAYKLCGELLIMDAGKTLKKGPARRIFRDPGCVEAARLTGCKNISPVRRTGAREIFALAWGLALETAVPVDPGVTHAGIRAHDFVPARGDASGAARNEIELELTRKSEDPFEYTVLFTNAAARGPAEKGELWWKYSKYTNYEIPRRLFIPPEAILLLRG
jgi:molybdate transport system ATP-binding protein